MVPVGSAIGWRRGVSTTSFTTLEVAPNGSRHPGPPSQEQLGSCCEHYSQVGGRIRPISDRWPSLLGFRRQQAIGRSAKLYTTITSATHIPGTDATGSAGRILHSATGIDCGGTIGSAAHAIDKTAGTNGGGTTTSAGDRATR